MKVWQKVKVEGDTLIGRAAHTLVAVDSHVVLYGGSADFQPNVGHCTRYFNDVYIMKTGRSISAFALLNHNCVIVLTFSDFYHATLC